MKTVNPLEKAFITDLLNLNIGFDTTIKTIKMPFGYKNYSGINSTVELWWNRVREPVEGICAFKNEKSLE